MAKYVLIWIATFITIFNVDLMKIEKLKELKKKRYFIPMTFLIVTSLVVVLAYSDNKSSNAIATKSDISMLESRIEELRSQIESKVNNNFQNDKGVIWNIDGIQHSDDIEVLESLNKILYLYSENRYIEAIQEIEKGQTLVMDPITKIDFFNISANIYYCIGDFMNAKEFYITALNTSNRNNLPENLKDTIKITQAAIYGNLGITFYKLGNTHQAIENISKSIELNEEFANKKDVAGSYNNLAHIYRDAGNLEYALNAYNSALEIFEEIGNKKGIITTKTNIGMIYKDFNQIDQAIDFSSRAYKYLKENYTEIDEATRLEASILNHLSLMYRDNHDYDQAENYSKAALDIASKYNFIDIKGNVLNNIGILHMCKNEYDEALTFFNESLLIHQNNKNRQSEGNAMVNIGIVYYEQRKMDLAKDYITKGYSIFDEIGYEIGKQTALQYLEILKDI
ncbi:MAG: tetratricopeptide repeat protein 28-like [Anaerosolibacter sp.]|jgi:tetratricopeptide (TPR) repeat protein|uniref:tetratricopeptide repeat protein n=1 Tax=Anaerosolibacter sp. TaxID=1872527 RepID=UPI0026349465|nr:tetratricopeptide repeat protein [Anaerosolibacter sp.]MDF2545773.1 tetratricopeptide repeat protein 28-like [Anaerosolibacter sp.]